MKIKCLLISWLLTLVMLVSVVDTHPILANSLSNSHGVLLTIAKLPAAADDDPQNQIVFSDLGISNDLTLRGPLDEAHIDFYFPLDWKLLSGHSLQLDVSALASSVVFSQSGFNMEGMIVGTLNVTLNGFPLQSFVVQGSGERIIDFPIPDEAFQPDVYSGAQRLDIQWDARDSCDYNLATNIVIRPTSRFFVPHTSQPIPIDITRFPIPFFLKNAVDQGGVSMVVPDQSSQAVLQAALSIAAALGRLTQDEIDFRLLPLSELSAEIKTNDHIILVGEQTAFESLTDLSIPASSLITPDAGVIQMINSPWNSARLIMLVSGADEQALLKAALAVSSAKLLAADADRSLSIIQDVQVQVETPLFTVDRTFSDLEQGDLIFNKFGTNTLSIPFDIPPGITIGADAYLDINFNHSQLMEYLRSGIVVNINATPVGSIRLGDSTSAYSTARMVIPASSLKTGANLIEIQVDLTPRSICSDPLQENIWVTIFDNSLLHLPAAAQYVVSTQSRELDEYPFLFNTQDELADTIFVFPAGDTLSWGVAARLAFKLGPQTSGTFSRPLVVFAENSPEDDLAQRNVILIGQPNKLPVLSTLAHLLPAQFDANNALTGETQEQITYQLPAGTSVGYLELAAQGDDQKNSLLAVLGNSDQGVEWAANALIDEKMRSMLSGGNFAFVQGQNVIVESLQSPPGIGEIEAPASEQTPIDSSLNEGVTTPLAPVSGEALPAVSQIHPWIIPALVATILIILIILGMKMITYTVEKHSK